MKRRNFFKNLGIGIGALVVAPKVLAEVFIDDQPKIKINNDVNLGFKSFKRNGITITYKDWKILDDTNYLDRDGSEAWRRLSVDHHIKLMKL